MSDATNSAELDGQHVELLPARTLLSLLSVINLGTDGSPGTPGTPGLGTPGPKLLPIGLPTNVVGDGGSGRSG